MGWQDAPAVSKWSAAPPADAPPAIPPAPTAPSVGGGGGWGDNNGPVSLADVPGAAASNFPESAKQFGKDIVQPIIHPVDTAKALGNLALGTIQKAVPGEQSSEKYADAVGEFLAKRYGGMEEIKKTMATDPVGFLADVATVLTVGGAATARLPGAAGKAGNIVQKAGRAVDPVNIALKGIKPAAKVAGGVAADLIGSVGTHTGGQSIRAAAKAGFVGGSAADTFRANISGSIPADDVVRQAKAAVTEMRLARGDAYRAEMSKIGKDIAVLDFDDIDRAVAKAAQVKRFKGVPISKSTAKVSGEIMDTVDMWKKLDPTDYHTAEGLDALKQAVGDIRDSTEFGSPSRTVANRAYGAIKDRIVKQAPEYAKVMKEYEEASDIIREMEKTLSLGEKASLDTSLRKLQSVLRNNANTNYGRRVDLAAMLVDAGAVNLMEALSGQALRDIAPRGLGRVVAGGTGVLAGTQAMGGVIDPTLLGALALQSPRVVGEAAFAGGKAARLAKKLPSATGIGAFQAGRLNEISP